MTFCFSCLAALTVAGALGAMFLRNLVHCALALAVALAGLALLYLQLGAQFVGLAQVLVYVGAVAILVVFAILLTRGGETSRGPAAASPWLTGIGAAVGVFAVLAGLLLWSRALPGAGEFPQGPPSTVGQIGDALMSRYVLPLEVLGLLLTVALIGAVLIAMHEKKP